MSHARKPAQQGQKQLSQYSAWLVTWIESVRVKYRLPEEHNQVLERALIQLRSAPETVVALEVGRLFYFFERNQMVTDKTPLADKAIQALIEFGRTGPIDKAPDDLRNWFRKHYLWATSTATLDIKMIQGDDAEELIGRYFQGRPGVEKGK